MAPSPSSTSSGAVDDAADGMPSKMFPLPADYFGSVQISASKKQEYNEIVRRRVNSLLADEYLYNERRARQLPVVQMREWKFFRRFRDVKVYQRRLNGRSRQEVAAEEEIPEAAIAVERGNPSMFAEGSVSGTMEDMLYGISCSTQGEMMTALSFCAPPQDAVLLDAVEKSTVEDPLRTTEILWVLSKLPILHPRDVCYMKASGSGKDAKGRSYGYLVLHSVDLPECPPFDYHKTKVLRAKMFFTFLFRETTPGHVDVIGRGVFDLVGDKMLKLVLPHATASVMDGLLRSVTCGEAKKLTMLAFKHYEERKQFKAISKRSVCSMCIRKNKGVLSGARLRPCDVCGVPICNKCKVKDKYLFTGIKVPCRKIMCCASCSQQAKAITGVRLGDPEFLVVAEFYCKNRPTASRSTLDRSAVAATATTPSVITSARYVQEDTATRNNEAGKFESTSLVSDVGKTISSVGMTNSTIGDSCASFDLDVSFAGTLSDLYPEEYHIDSYDNGLEEEPEPPHPGVSAELLKEYSELGDVTKETGSSGPKAYDENYRHDANNFAMRTPRSASKRRPNNMLEWMLELQSSAEEAYFTAKANEELMKKSMR